MPTLISKKEEHDQRFIKVAINFVFLAALIFCIMYYNNFIKEKPDNRIEGYDRDLLTIKFHDGLIYFTEDRQAVWYKDIDGHVYTVSAKARLLTPHHTRLSRHENPRFKNPVPFLTRVRQHRKKRQLDH